MSYFPSAFAADFWSVFASLVAVIFWYGFDLGEVKRRVSSSNTNGINFNGIFLHGCFGTGYDTSPVETEYLQRKRNGSGTFYDVSRDPKSLPLLW